MCPTSRVPPSSVRLSGFSLRKSGASRALAQDSVHHRLEEAADVDLLQALAEDDVGGRGAAGGGPADRAAAQAEDDVPAVQDRARRRRGRGRPDGDQGREEHQLEILGSGKNNKSPSFHLETMHLLHGFHLSFNFCSSAFLIYQNA